MKFHFLCLLLIMSLAAAEPPYNAHYKSSNGDLTLIMNIEGWPPVVGEKIKIIVKAISMPPAVDDKEDLKFYSSRLNRFLDKSFDNAKHITLHSIERAENEFAVKADIRLEGRSLSRILLKEGLAVKKLKPEKEVESRQKDSKPEGNRPSQKTNIEKEHNTSRETEINKDTAKTYGKDKRTEKKAGCYKFCASKNSQTFHKTDCFFVERILEKNLVYFSSYKEAADSGREPCQSCKPQPREQKNEETAKNK
ncbi:hypothetical protein [Sedimentisphaera salicampi]|uniref:Ada DNA repair metal-binding domain-containing protein n=1 Tax=Sedimentisphaera salicampi TaxID=1941349 RepID=A0A1W6LJL6_9BACT|nr:hypothetical protein [Sedimentisphaera salicampi]ARN55988.1 hypothetical protein STSP1_00358 [Sedimentisphaera salicampi]